MVLYLPSKLSVVCSVIALGACALFAQSATYRNVALNPQDVHDSVWNRLTVKKYPHAQSNSECRMDPVFFARCAINDTLKNTCHGAGCPSWGPDQSTAIWWKVGFGKNVAVDSVTLYIRADFPHDGYWTSGRLSFSDGSKIMIKIDSTAKPQGYKFSRRVTQWMKIDSLLWHVPNTWCGMTQVQVWGNDTLLTAVAPLKRFPAMTNPGKQLKGTLLLNGRSIYKNRSRQVPGPAVRLFENGSSAKVESVLR